MERLGDLSSWAGQQASQPDVVSWTSRPVAYNASINFRVGVSVIGRLPLSHFGPANRGADRPDRRPPARYERAEFRYSLFWSTAAGVKSRGPAPPPWAVVPTELGENPFRQGLPFRESS